MTRKPFKWGNWGKRRVSPFLIRKALTIFLGKGILLITTVFKDSKAGQGARSYFKNQSTQASI
jgi:hypothetical protein